jgi:TPR repeat protein
MSLVCVSPAFADKYDDGLKAFKSEDYKKAISIWTSAELQTEPRAQFGLGSIYMRGLGVPRDRTKAVTYYQRSAEQGHASAQFNLGLAYMKGRGVEKNTAKAIAWWEKAAKSDHAAAQYNIAALLWSGQEVPRNQAAAMKWFRMSLANGSEQASNFLYSLFAPMYSELKENHALYRGTNTARTIPLVEEMGMFKLAQQAMAAGSFEQAFNYWLPLAEDGHDVSQFMIAGLYEQGQGVQADMGEALKWYEDAAKAGMADAQYRLGLYYLNEAPEANETLGLYWMQSAADNDLPAAVEFMKKSG